MKHHAHKKKTVSSLTSIFICCFIIGIVILAIYILKASRSGVSPFTQNITIMPDICTKSYTKLPDMLYRNTFQNLYYGKFFGTIEKVTKESKQITMHIKVPHGIYVFSVPLTKSHNIVYDIKTRIETPLSQLTARKEQAEIAFSCEKEKPDSLSVSVTF